MSNTIVIELCQEDRERLDKLTAAMERKACNTCVTAALEYKAAVLAEAKADPIQEKLAETLANATDPVEAPKNATEEAEISTQATTPQEEETPTHEEPADEPTARTVDRAELRAKVIELSAKGLKEQTRDIVKSYAQTVKDVPEDKVTECYDRLVALEG